MQPTQPTQPQPPQPPQSSPQMPPRPPFAPQQPTHIRLLPLWITLGVLAIVIGLCGSFSLGYAIGVTPVRATPTVATTSGQAQIVTATSTPKGMVLVVSGHGDKTTQSFTVHGTWRMDWTCTSDGATFFDIGIANASDNTYSGNQGIEYTCPRNGSGSDSSTYHEGGTFYLVISSNVAYTVTVTDLPN